MRMLSGLLGLSGLVWVGGPLLLNAMEGGTQSWPLTVATFGSPVVIAGTVATFLSRTATQVVRSLAVVWLIAVTVGSVILAHSSGPSLAAAGAALLFVSLAFALASLPVAGLLLRSRPHAAGRRLTTGLLYASDVPRAGRTG